jgi:hypothetical protein
VSAAALLAGLLVGRGLRPLPPTAAPPEVAHAGPDDGLRLAAIEDLERALDRERGLRGALEIELALLRDSLAPEAGMPAAPGTPGESGAPGTANTTDATHATAADGERTESKPEKDWFDERQLIENGFDERHAAWLRERFETLQMDELYLRDQATREGWRHKPRFGRKLRQLQNDARADLGDEDYDQLLYAAGRNNRVVLNDVLASSPAADAGIEAGDLLVRYDGHMIFGVRDLLAGTASGELGTQVAIDVERNGAVLRFFVERGPLGAKIQPTRQAPPVAP